MAPSPRKIFLDNIDQSVILKKKTELIKVWEENVVPQLESGKLKLPSSFGFYDYVNSINSILDLPINKRVDRIEKELMTNLDLFPDIEKKLFENANDIFTTSLSNQMITARVIQCSEKEFLILLNEGLINFTQAVVTWCVMFKSKRDNAEGGEDLEELVISLRKKARSYLKGYKEKLVLIEDFTLQPTRDELYLINKITNHSIKFAIAHEYGHIVNDDFKQGIYKSEAIANHQLKVYQKKEAKEIKADRFAFDLLHKVNCDFADQDDLDFLVAGIVALFLAMDLLEFNLVNSEDYDAHQKIRNRGSEVIKQVNEKLQDHLELAAFIEDAFNVLFEDFYLMEDES